MSPWKEWLLIVAVAALIVAVGFVAMVAYIEAMFT